MFPGKTNNDMLYLFMQVIGPMTKKEKKGEFVHLYFDELGTFKRILGKVDSNVKDFYKKFFIYLGKYPTCQYH